MKTLKIISIFLVLVGFYSCEDFLEEQDPSQITNATFWNTADELEKGLTATYSALKQTYLWSSQGYKNMNSRGDDIIARLQNSQIYRPDLQTGSIHKRSFQYLCQRHVEKFICFNFPCKPSY